MDMLIRAYIQSFPIVRVVLLNFREYWRHNITYRVTQIIIIAHMAYEYACVYTWTFASFLEIYDGQICTTMKLFTSVYNMIKLTD